MLHICEPMPAVLVPAPRAMSAGPDQSPPPACLAVLAGVTKQQADEEQQEGEPAGDAAAGGSGSKSFPQLLVKLFSVLLQGKHSSKDEGADDWVHRCAWHNLCCEGHGMGPDRRQRMQAPTQACCHTAPVPSSTHACTCRCIQAMGSTAATACVLAAKLLSACLPAGRVP